MSQRISFKVTGTVQGVNFRSSAAEAARKEGITGYAQNASDGTVVGEAQGEENSIVKFVESMKGFTSPIKVTGISQNTIDVKSGEKGFARK